MKPRSRHAIACLLVLAPLLAAWAGPAEDKVAAALLAKTGMKAEQVSPAPIPGLWEIFLNRHVFYVDAEVRYLIAGQIFDTKTETDLTARRVEELTKIKWDALPLDDAIKITYGDGSRRVAVFTDARCGYCAQLEKNLKQVSNVTVYNFIYPVLNSWDMSRDVVCSADPAVVWQAHMIDGVVPPKVAPCAAESLTRNLRLGQRLGLTGTPSIIFSDGTMVTGAPPPEELDRRL